MCSICSAFYGGIFGCEHCVILSACFCVETNHASSDSCQQELEGLLQQAAAPDGHISFDQRSGGETWEQNVRRIATDVVCLG